MKLVMVIWTDALSATSWEQTRDRTPSPPLKCETVGWLLTELPTYIEVAQTVADRGGPDEQVTNIKSIPRQAIVSMFNISPTTIMIDT